MSFRIISVLIIISHSLFSQERSLIVRVVETGTEKPIKGANIVIPDDSAATFTNHLGYFQLNVNPAKHSTLQISHIDYKILQIQIPSGDRFKIYLDHDTTNLNTLNLNLYPKTDKVVNEQSNSNNSLAESEATYPGGIENFYFTAGNALAPLLPNVSKKGFTVTFIIDESGKPATIALSDSSKVIHTAVTEVFQKMPLWIPATQRQTNVKQMFKIVVNRHTKVLLQAGDLKDLYTFIRREIRYPAQAKRMGIEGPIFTQFSIDEAGNVLHIFLLKGVNADCNGEVKRVISSVPPAYFKSLFDKTQQKDFILPVFFGLDNALKKGRDYIANDKAYMLPPVDIIAGGLVIQRREIGNGSATTISRGSFPKPEPVIITFTVLGEALAIPGDVQRLSLRNNGLTVFPKDILQLTKINFLDLENNQLSDLPENINVLTELKELYLLNNRLTNLPDNFSSFKKLRVLGMSNNQLNSFPKQITALEKLETLDLSNNHLTEIPAEIGLLKNLEVLVLSNNYIKQIPPELLTLKKLNKIFLEGNEVHARDLELLRKTFKKAQIVP